MNIRLLDLWNGITATIEFIKVTSPSSSHTSDHLPISTSTLFELPAIEETTMERHINKSCLDVESYFLYDLIKLQKMKIHYASETDIQSCVKQYLQNILRIAGIDEEVRILQNGSLGRDSTDVYIVMTNTGVPLMVCEVKCPIIVNGEKILNNLKVQGQLYDYMVDLRNLYGQDTVFGVLTNLQDWRICCFEDTVDYATTTDIKIDSTRVDYSERIMDINSRSFCVSRLVALTENNLPKWLILYILKAKYSRYFVVPLLSEKRYLLTYTKDTYYWDKAPSGESISLRIPAKQTMIFSILRYFRGGADGKVALAITKSTPNHLCVLKEHYIDNDLTTELNNWKLFNEFNCYVKVLFSKRKMLVIPLVFHVTERDGIKTINFNLSEWSKEEVTQVKPCIQLDRMTEKVTQCWNNMNITIEDIAIQAVMNIANHGYEHLDIKWNHVGLMPIIDDNDQCNVLSLKPVLIDLVRMNNVHDKHIAWERMKRVLFEELRIDNELLNSYSLLQCSVL